MCRSPLAFTVMSRREWGAGRASIWSGKPMPVETDAAPCPSRATETSTSVSLVLRLIDAVRMARLLSGVAMFRYCGARTERKGGKSAVRPAFLTVLIGVLKLGHLRQRRLT